MRKAKDLTGKRFGHWAVVERVLGNKGKGDSPKWLCLCDCGTQAVVNSRNLASGRSTQCQGCAVALRCPKKSDKEIEREAEEAMFPRIFANEEEDRGRIAKLLDIPNVKVCEIPEDVVDKEEERRRTYGD